MTKKPSDSLKGMKNSARMGRKETSSASEAYLKEFLKLHPKSIDLSLDRLQRLLKALGHPEASLPATIHIAGTNGKGSTQAFLRAFLEAQGKKVHSYTSPHLVRFHERIRLGSHPIDEEKLLDLFERCSKANQGQAITFFEMTTAAAFLAFSEDPADVLLLEVGLGGRFDATNVIPKASVTVITPVSLDHPDFLGTDLRKIAWEKAGILKENTPLVLSPQTPEAQDVILGEARALHCPVFDDFSITDNADDFFSYHSGQKLLTLLDAQKDTKSNETARLKKPTLSGPHQRINASVALTAAQIFLHLCEETLSSKAIEQGLKVAFWPGRLQKLSAPKLLSLLPKGSEVWLDGAHNEAAGEALADWVQEHKRQKGSSPYRLHVIAGMLNTKNAKAFFSALAPYSASIQTLSIPEQPNSLSAEEASKMLPHTRPASSLEQALHTIQQQEKANCTVLICGSLTLAGWVLREYEPSF